MAASSDEGVIVRQGMLQRAAKIITLRDHPAKRLDENSPAYAGGVAGTGVPAAQFRIVGRLLTGGTRKLPSSRDSDGTR